MRDGSRCIMGSFGTFISRLVVADFLNDVAKYFLRVLLVVLDHWHVAR